MGRKSLIEFGMQLGLDDALSLASQFEYHRQRSESVGVCLFTEHAV